MSDGFLKRSAAELGEFCFRAPFHKEGDEVTNRCMVEPVMNRPDGLLHCHRRQLGELRAEAVDDLPDHAVFFDGGDSHTISMRHRSSVLQRKEPTISLAIGVRANWATSLIEELAISTQRRAAPYPPNLLPNTGTKLRRNPDNQPLVSRGRRRPAGINDRNHDACGRLYAGHSPAAHSVQSVPGR